MEHKCPNYEYISTLYRWTTFMFICQRVNSDRFLETLFCTRSFRSLLQFGSLSVGHSESRRMTDELGSRQRDLSTSSVTKRANGHWHAIIASSCRWSQREYKRQPVHRVNHPFASDPSGGAYYCSPVNCEWEAWASAGVTAQQRWSRSHGRINGPWRQSHQECAVASSPACFSTERAKFLCITRVIASM